jgi:hypothetical protein
LYFFKANIKEGKGKGYTPKAFGVESLDFVCLLLGLFEIELTAVLVMGRSKERDKCINITHIGQNTNQ